MSELKNVWFYSVHCDQELPMTKHSSVAHEFSGMIPQVGLIYQDVKYPRRRLLVTEFAPSSAIERHVVGLVSWSGPPPTYEEQSAPLIGIRSHVGSGASGEYSCSLKVFQDVWRPL